MRSIAIIVVICSCISLNAQRVIPQAPTVVSGVSSIKSVADIATLSLPELGVVLVGNAKYVVQSLPLANYTTDGIAVQATANSRYAVLQAQGDSYLYSHFKNDTTTTQPTLQRAYDFIEAAGVVWKLLYDGRDTLKRTFTINRNEGMEGISLVGPRAGSDAYANQPVLYIDKNDSSEAGIVVTGGTGAGYHQGGGIFNMNIVVLSPLFVAVEMIRPFNYQFEGNLITGVNFANDLQNGIRSTGAVNQPWRDNHIYYTNQNGIWLYDSEHGATTMELSDCFIHHGNVGLRGEQGTIKVFGLILEELTQAVVFGLSAGNFFGNNITLEDVPKDSVNVKIFDFQKGGEIGIRDFIFNGNTPFHSQSTAFALDSIRGFSIQSGYIQNIGKDFTSTLDCGGISVRDVIEQKDNLRDFLIRDDTLNVSNIANSELLVVENLCPLFGNYGADCLNYFGPTAFNGDLQRSDRAEGTESTTTDANGDVSISHGLGFTPTNIKIRPISNTWIGSTIVEASVDNTAFTVRFFNHGATNINAINAGSVQFYWSAE